MSEIKVPDGMLKAALESQFKRWGYDISLWIELRGKYEGAARSCLEAALRWLSENPIVPTEKQWNEMENRYSFNASLLAVEWQRRMFLTPEPIEDWNDKLLANFPPGYTPTHAELDKIWEHIFRAGHGWVPPEQRSEIKAKEEIEDLFFRSDVEEKGRGMSGNERIKEAYRRGREAK